MYRHLRPMVPKPLLTKGGRLRITVCYHSPVRRTVPIPRERRKSSSGPLKILIIIIEGSVRVTEREY